MPLIIPEDSNIDVRVYKYIDFVIQGKIVIKSPIVSRNGSRNISGHNITYNGDSFAFKLTPRVYWECVIDGVLHKVRVATKEHNLDLDELIALEKQISFPLTNHAPDFLMQMAKDPVFINRFGNNPFWVQDYKYGPNSVAKQADAYIHIKRLLMSNEKYLQMMKEINAEWDRCYEQRGNYLKEFLADVQHKAKREKDFIKKFVHFLTERPELASLLDSSIAHCILQIPPQVLKEIAAFNKRNAHDIPHISEEIAGEACDIAKVSVVMKS